MSGPEFVAVLGIVASAIDVIGACNKVIERIRQYGQSIAFEDLKTQLQLFSKEISHLSEPMDHLDVDQVTEAILGDVLKGCRRQLEKMDKVLQSVIPNANSSKLKRTIYGVRSIAKERELREILSILSAYQASILLHLSRRNVQNTAQVPRLISLLEDKIITEKSQHSKPATDQTVDFTTSKVTTVAAPQPLRLRNKHSLKRASKCSRGVCECQCHSSANGILWSWIVIGLVRSIVCGCENQEYSIAIQLFRTLCVLKLSKNWQDGISITCSLQYYGVVKYTFPGFMVLYKCQQGLIGLSQAREELRTLRLKGEINFKEVDPSGRGWIEKVLISPWQSDRRDVQFGLLDDLFLETAIIPADAVLRRCMYWIGQGPHLSLLEYLLARGVDPSEAGIELFPSWPSPCYIHMWEPYILDDPFFIRSIAMLVRADIDSSFVQPLQRAVLMNSFTDLKFILSIKQASKFSERNFLGQTVLHLAIQNSQMLSCLIESGFPNCVDAQDRNSSTPLMYAAAYNQCESAMILLKCGADPYVLDRLNGSSFLGYLMWQGNYGLLHEVVRNYREKEAEESAQNMLDYCLWNYMNIFLLQWVDPNSKGLRYLLQAGARCSMISMLGNTVLHLASSSYHASLLLNYSNICVNYQNSQGHTPLMSFCYFHDLFLIKQTLSAGAFVNSVDKKAMNALQHAIRFLQESIGLEGEEQTCREFMDIIAVLLTAGIDVSNCDSCVCFCSSSGCTAANFIFQIRNRRYSHGPILSGVMWQMEFYHLLKFLRGPEALRRILAAFFRIQKFEELGMTHTCCIREHDKDYITDKGTVFEIEEDAQEVMDEQKELKEILETACLEFETQSGCSDEQLWIRAIARRATFVEEAKEKLNERISSRLPGVDCLEELKARSGIEVISEDPLCYVDHTNDDLYTANVRITPILKKSERTLESQVQEFSVAAQLYPFYENNVLPATYDRSLWDSERRRLADLFLVEAEKIHRQPPEFRNWDFDSLGLGL